MDSVPLHHVWQYTDVDRAFWQEHLDAWLPQRIIDAHTHVCEPRFLLEKATEAKRRQYWVNEINDPIAAEDAARCYATVLPGREFTCIAFGHPSLDFDIPGSNTALQAECENRGWYRLAVIGPDWPVEQIVRELDKPNTLGVKVYYALIPDQDPDSRDKYLEASIFDFLTHEQLRLLNDRRAMLMLHVPKADRLGHPDNIREIREIRDRYGDIQVVIAHLGRSYTLPHAQESLPKLADDEGLWFDNSAVFNPDVHRLALDTLGPHRILYGTDNPIFYMRGRRRWEGRRYINHTSHPFHFNTNRETSEIEAQYTLYMYEALRTIKQTCEELGLSRDDVEAIFHTNAERLIRLSNPQRTKEPTP